MIKIVLMAAGVWFSLAFLFVFALLMTQARSLPIRRSPRRLKSQLPFGASSESPVGRVRKDASDWPVEVPAEA